MRAPEPRAAVMRQPDTAFLFDTALKIQRKLKIKRTPPLKHTAYMGSQWWCLRRSTLEKVWSLYQNKPILKKFYRRTWVPDELFFQTMVANTAVPIDNQNSMQHLSWNTRWLRLGEHTYVKNKLVWETCEEEEAA